MTMVSELGLGAALSVMVFVSFFFLLKWVLKTSGEQLKSMNEERASWAVVMKGLQDQRREDAMTNRAFFEAVQEAHRFQREEHQEMIKSLGRINGYKK